MDKETAALRRAYLTLRKKVDEASMLLDEELPTEIPPPDLAGSNSTKKERPEIRGIKDGDPELWKNYQRHRPPPKGDVAVTSAILMAEHLAADFSRGLNKPVFIYAYRNNKLELVRLSVGIDDRPNWPKPRRGRIDKLGVWQAGMPVNIRK